MKPIVVEPIGYVRSPRAEIRDDDWGDVVARIELARELPSECLDGIDEFSHVEVLFHFHRVPDRCVVRGARHPRGNVEWPRVGIFAQRAKDRPNRLGSSIAELVAREGRSLTVRGLDAIDGTPVLDLKPVLRELLPQCAKQPSWATDLMRAYWTSAPEEL